MTRAKFILTGLLAVALVGGGLLFGDDPKPKGGKLPPNWSKLGLSDDQKRQIYTIEADYKGKIDDLQGQIDQLKKKQRGEMNKVLTDAQKARLREIIAAKAGADTADTGAPRKKDGDK